MPYNSIIDRTDAGALIPESVSKEIVQGIPQQSAALSLLKKLPNMSRKQQRMPVLSSLPIAYFVNGDNGLKQTSKVDWSNKYINAEELAVIVPVPESVLDDVDYDIWAEIKPLLIQAFGQAIDGAVFFGVNAPAAWPTAIVTAAAAAGNSVKLGTGSDIADDIGNEDGIMAKVEACGFDVNGFAGDVSIKAKLRGLRTSTGELIYQPSLQVGTPASLYGQPAFYPKNGVWNAATALLLCGDFDQAVYAMRQDITYKVLSEAVIQDGAGNIIYNLAQQDMVALRAVMRLGWQVPNPINAMKSVEATRYPFAVLVP